jgi:hypothetical protein
MNALCSARPASDDPTCYPAATAASRAGRKPGTCRAEPFAVLCRLSPCIGPVLATLRPFPTEWRRREWNPRSVPIAWQLAKAEAPRTAEVVISGQAWHTTSGSARSVS